jgi:hypothetical protein
MENNLQISNEENYFLQKREEIEKTLLLPHKNFLEKSYDLVKIKELKTEPNFVFLISGWIAQTSLLMQIKGQVDKYIKQDIFNMLTSHWSVLSFEELVKAFELERFGVYDEKTEHYQAFDANYISNVLKKYKNWKQKTKTELNITSSSNLIPEITESQKKEIIDNGIIRKYTEFKETGRIEDPFVYIFDELYSRDLIRKVNPDDPSIKKYYEKILQEAILEIKYELKSSSSFDKNTRSEIKNQIEKLENGNTDLAQIRAKMNVLKAFFKRYLEKEDEFKKIIKN